MIRSRLRVASARSFGARGASVAVLVTAGLPSGSGENLPGFGVQKGKRGFRPQKFRDPV